MSSNSVFQTMVFLIFSICFLSETASADPDSAVWFVVTPIDGNRDLSYLLPLSEPADIDHARRLVNEGPGAVAGIVSARIAAGADGFNRNMLDPQTPLWSWHVIGVEGFGDFAIELCDGNPQLVEDDVDGWIINTGGVICFWGYTISAELSEAPAYGIHAGAEGGWYNPQTPGQGFFFDVVNGGRTLFVGWLTFTFEEDSTVSQHRWYTAQGPIAGSRADLDLRLTQGGRFDMPDPVQPSPPGTVGSLTVELKSCNAGTASYELSNGLNGTFDIVPMQTSDDC